MMRIDILHSKRTSRDLRSYTKKHPRMAAQSSLACKPETSNPIIPRCKPRWPIPSCTASMLELNDDLGKPPSQHPAVRPSAFSLVSLLAASSSATPWLPRAGPTQRKRGERTKRRKDRPLACIGGLLYFSYGAVREGKVG